MNGEGERGKESCSAELAEVNHPTISSGLLSLITDHVRTALKGDHRHLFPLLGRQHELVVAVRAELVGLVPFPTEINNLQNQI
jgi:hypothetical protein